MKNKQILSNDFVFLLDDLGSLNDLENKACTLRTFVYLNNDIYLEIDKNKKFIHISLNFSKPFIEITSFAPKYLRPDTSLFAQNIKKYFANAKLSKEFYGFWSLNHNVYCETKDGKKTLLVPYSSNANCVEELQKLQKVFKSKQ
jgi:hypothetical protein